MIFIRLSRVIAGRNSESVITDYSLRFSAHFYFVPIPASVSDALKQKVGLSIANNNNSPSTFSFDTIYR